MSHSAELSRRMARARISACHSRRASDTHFQRHQPPELERIPWQSRPPLLPYGFDWRAVLDAAIVMASIVFALAVAVGALP